VTVHADDLDPADEVWPRPQLVDGVRVFTFDDTGAAYDQTQVRDDIHDGDVLHIPAEHVAGFLMQAWPVAVSEQRGAFYELVDSGDLVIDGKDYSPSARVALSALGEPEPPAPPRSPSSGYGLQEAPNVWTVTIAGSERYDGEAPYTWVVTAANATIAAAIAECHHRINEEDTDTIVRYVDPGAPNANYPYAYNDLRGIPSRLFASPRTTSAASPVSGSPTDASTNRSSGSTPTRSTPPTQARPTSPSTWPPTSPCSCAGSWTNSATAFEIPPESVARALACSCGRGAGGGRRRSEPVRSFGRTAAFFATVDYSATPFGSALCRMRFLNGCGLGDSHRRLEPQSRIEPRSQKHPTIARGHAV
jgi:hypothetical protein